MKKLVFFPSDPMKEYIEKGRTYEFLDEYYNPGNYFDEVICLSPWGDKTEEKISSIRCIKASPYRLKKIIEKEKPDIVRGYGAYCCADWVSFNKVKGIPTLVSAHDVRRSFIHDSISYADGVICMSNAVKNAVEKYVPGVTSNIWVMPNRIDTTVFSKKNDDKIFSELNNRFSGKYHILHVGRKSYEKNLETVIKALKYLDESVTAVFVGAGDTAKYEELANKEGVSDRCFYVERVENEELPYWYSWCDCMCTPSLCEGFGYVFVEAAACECAIVTSDIGPMNEYLIDEKTALLVKEFENPEIIANAVKKCLSGEEGIAKMKKNARNVGLSFDKSAVAKQEIEIYEKMMSIQPNNLNNNSLKRKMILFDGINCCEKGCKNFLKLFKADKLYHKIIGNDT